jgi:hypothetical protein
MSINENDPKLKKLQQSLDDFTSGNFLIPDDVKRDNLVRCCIDILKDCGYIIKIPAKNVSNVTNMNDLILHYYTRLDRFYPNIRPNRDEKKDRKIGSDLIKRIKNDFNLEYKSALLEAVKIIDIILANPDRFEIEHGMVGSFSILGQGKMKWLTDKAISALNSTEYQDARSIELADKWGEEYLASNGKELGYL